MPKITPTVNKYTLFVLEELVDIKGTNPSNVANYIIKEWIGEHKEELKEYGITIQKARKKGVIHE